MSLLILFSSFPFSFSLFLFWVRELLTEFKLEFELFLLSLIFFSSKFLLSFLEFCIRIILFIDFLYISSNLLGIIALQLRIGVINLSSSSSLYFLISV